MGEQARVYEARTLLFLASWIENAGSARDFPLHVACIGEPPASVRWLAKRCDAELSVHRPLDAGCGRYSNKLRGLEVRRREDRVLLLDVDVLVLSDLSELAEMGHCIAASPVLKPRLPKRYWRVIYPLLGMDPPRERVASVLGELLSERAETHRSPRQNARLRSMFPYHSSGVLLSPWDCGLRPLWEDHIRRIAARFQETDDRARFLELGDEPGLTTSIELLKRRGVPYARLPDACHIRLVQVWGGVVRWPDAKLLHTAGIFRAFGRSALDAGSVWNEMDHYCSRAKGRRVNSKNRFQDVIRRDPEQFLLFIGELRTQLRRLFELHVAEALQQAV